MCFCTYLITFAFGYTVTSPFVVYKYKEGRDRNMTTEEIGGLNVEVTINDLFQFSQYYQNTKVLKM